SSDWIELFNSTAAPLNLVGWHLTDDPTDLAKWQIPDLPLAANQRRVIYASGKDQDIGELHTSFSIDKEGGYLALVKPDGVTVTSSYNFGQQYGDISYGTLGEDQSEGYFGTPSPGSSNLAPQGIPVQEKPAFSHDDQVITRNISLTLSASSPTASIRYTTNGSEPTASSSLYLSPIPISSTTRVKARIFEPGLQPGPVRDRTYLRLSNDIRSFTSDLPIIIIDSFGANIDGESSSNSQNPRRPVQSIFVDVDALSGRAAVTDTPDFAGRGGMRVRGQTSSGFPKKQYSFETWDSDGDDKDVSIFGWPSESDWIIHAPYSDKTLMRNKIVYDCSRELGYPSVRTRFCELFFNSN
ncbi:MAG: chitobiase/beta-hexosaminidase C-terminal domain-containing protein, partial [Verrucomicrobiota bacterium]|nr:chitobiase/beta-hexosaminidase C-terminal domain-containing protein [Verrucomicrobiota bacterium]